MNEEKYILARFKEEIIKRAATYKKIHGYGQSFDAEDILSLLAALEAASMFDIEVDSILNPEVPLLKEAEG